MLQCPKCAVPYEVAVISDEEEGVALVELACPKCGNSRVHQMRDHDAQIFGQSEAERKPDCVATTRYEPPPSYPRPLPARVFGAKDCLLCGEPVTQPEPEKICIRCRSEMGEPGTESSRYLRDVMTGL
jgi:Zn finger protein HypA/HybF involved in hydrogenase expression